MPDKVFHSLHEHPRWSDRALTHPIVIVALWSILVGVAMVASSLVPGLHVSQSVSAFPDALTASLGMGIALGGAAASLGILTGGKRSWIIESGGWWLCGLGWALHGAIVASIYPASILAWGTSIALAWMAATRIRALVAVHREARTVEREIEARRLTSGDGGHETGPPA